VQGTLMCMALGLALPCGSAWAQAEPAAASAAALAFSIAPGPLDAALNRFARAAGINLSYDAALVSGASTRGLNGTHGVASGLGLLLAGSGIDAVAQPGGGFALRKAAPAAVPAGSATLPAVTVRARRTAKPRPARCKATSPGAARPAPRPTRPSSRRRSRSRW
jgi:outer membrane receptor for ferric coprogen and ferric-rhodotorulic acid